VKKVNAVAVLVRDSDFLLLPEIDLFENRKMILWTSGEKST